MGCLTCRDFDTVKHLEIIRLPRASPAFRVPFRWGEWDGGTLALTLSH